MTNFKTKSFKNYYPINLNIEGKKCIVVGGGVVAQRKVKSLLKCAAKVTVISPDLSKRLTILKKKKKIIHINKRYNPSYLKKAFLIIAATDDPKVNASLGNLSKKNKNILINVSDRPHCGNFIMPAVLRRGVLNVAISTSGISPALAKRIRLDIEKLYKNKYKKLLSLLTKMRPAILKQVKDIKKRRKILRKLAGQCI